MFTKNILTSGLGVWGKKRTFQQDLANFPNSLGKNSDFPTFSGVEVPNNILKPVFYFEQEPCLLDP